MPELSVCMPSNRDFANSRRAIETAVAFCEARDAVLIVSDNSRDAEKAAYWQGRSPVLHYIPDAPIAATDNQLSALGAAKTPFLLQIGDDDEIFSNPKVVPVDLGALGDDYIGVKPVTEMFLPGMGPVRRQEFGLEKDDPGLRLRDYLAYSDGSNVAYYSIFRTAPFMDLTRFFLSRHPTRGGFCDWQIAFAFWVIGKLKSDPSIIYRYNASQWSTEEVVRESALKSYLAAGLTAEFQKYKSLIRGLDFYVFISRKNAGLTAEAIAKLQNGEASDLIDLGLDQILRMSDGTPDTALVLARKALGERNPAVKYLSGCAVLEQFVPGLQLKYVAFLKAAISGT